MRLIVGLGNPDPEYQWTPHNLGFMAVDELANLSGISVRDLLGKYELDAPDLLMIWDEVQLPLGTIRIHPDGSAGSHNGAKSVISAIGTQEFARLRLGCGPEHPL